VIAIGDLEFDIAAALLSESSFRLLAAGGKGDGG
jgi:hypothetical protein